VGNFEKICSLASGKGSEKTIVFSPAPQGRLCRFPAPTLARAWGIAIPIKVVDASKARFELLAATAKLALCFFQYCFHNRTQKIIRVTISSKIAARIFFAYKL
jgi:hypothetical protein